MQGVIQQLRFLQLGHKLSKLGECRMVFNLQEMKPLVYLREIAILRHFCALRASISIFGGNCQILFIAIESGNRGQRHTQTSCGRKFRCAEGTEYHYDTQEVSSSIRWPPSVLFLL